LVYPVADPRSLPPTAPNRIHVRSMSQPTQTLSAVAGIKAGNEGGKVSSASRPVGPIAIEGEGGLAYFHKMRAQGGPAGPGESELQGSAESLYPSHYICQSPQQLFHM